jgi:Tol biopolymer transport system component
MGLALGLLLIACNGNGGAEDARGALVLTTLEGPLSSLDLASGDATTLVEPPSSGGHILYPAVSPDGASIAYVAQPSLTAGSSDAGMDIWIANRDGSGARIVFAHATQNQQVLYPQWQGNSSILAIIQEQGTAGVAFQLQRIDVATGARTPLAEGIFGFAVAPGGDRLAVSVLTDAGLALHLTDADGASPVPLLTPADRLSPFGHAQFSPDGATLAFASAEVVSASSSAQLVAYGPPADGVPQDIWTVDLAGGDPRRVAELFEDSPSLSWNGDGTLIYTQGTKGLHEIDLANGAVERIGEGVFHGQVAFLP